MPIARSVEQISPELALVDDELDSTARRALPDASDCLAPPVDVHPVAPGPRRRGSSGRAARSHRARSRRSLPSRGGTRLRHAGRWHVDSGRRDASEDLRSRRGSTGSHARQPRDRRRRLRSPPLRAGRASASPALARGSRRRVLQRHPLARELTRPRPLAPAGRRRRPARVVGSRGVPVVRLPGARDG